MSKMNQTQLSDAVRKIMEKAAADELFHAMCLSDSAQAFQAGAGVPLPEDIKVRFVECADNDLLVVLPPLRVQGAEVSAEELEQVVGGVSASDVGHGFAVGGGTMFKIGGTILLGGASTVLGIGDILGGL